MNETYVELVRREFARLRDLAERAMAQLNDEQFFAAPAPDDNSVAVIVKHMSGNLWSRWSDFLTTDGEKPERDRDTEFRLEPGDTRVHLVERWTLGWRTLFDALTPLRVADLSRTIRIRGEPLTVLQGINRQLTHYAYHVGQIVYVAKHHRGAAWQTLSIPLGQSAAFNQQPARYLEPGGPAPVA